MDTSVLCVSLVFGSLSLGSTIWVYIKHRVFGFGGTILSITGIILIGMSVWKSIEIQAKDVRIILEKNEKEIKKAQEEIQDLINFNRSFVVQARLKELNMYKGPLDGSLNSQFKIAITNYQSLHGIQPTGIIDDKTLLSIKNNNEVTGFKGSERGGKKATPLKPLIGTGR